MKLKKYIFGSVLLTGVMWLYMGIFAIYVWAWYEWMTLMGIFYTAFIFAAGIVFWLVGGEDDDDDD